MMYLEKKIQIFFHQTGVLIALEIWLFVDQFLASNINHILMTTYNPIPHTLYKCCTLILFAIAMAYFISNCHPTIIILLAFLVLDVCICIINIPFLQFFNYKDKTILMIGVLIYKIFTITMNDFKAD